MSALQSGNTEIFADGSAAWPSVQIGRPDTGFFVKRDANGVPTSIGVSIAGAEAAGALDASQTFGAPTATAPVDYVAEVAATNTLSSSNVQVTANDTVTVNGKVYTFVASPAIEGDVHLVTNADTSLGNLVKAINLTGSAGVDYFVAAAHPTVSAGAVASHATTLTARTAGAAGNSLTLAVSAVTLTPGGATFSGGVTLVNGTTGVAGQLIVASGVAYVCLSTATITSTGAWKKISTASL
jgi:hypothetical protein